MDTVSDSLALRTTGRVLQPAHQRAGHAGPSDIMADEFPDDLRQFLAGHISSVAQLETLLLMRSQREREWSADEISQALATTVDMTSEQLAELHTRGLLARKDGPRTRFQYWPATPDLDAQVGRLETTYRERRVAVITAIYSQPVDRVRTFADAFRLRKD